MRISPLELEQAPRSRVLEWIHFWDEQAAYEAYKTQEAMWQASQPTERTH